MMTIFARQTESDNLSVASIRNNVGTQSTQYSPCTLVTTESQTQTSSYFAYEDIDRDNNQISMDIETQTSSMD